MQESRFNIVEKVLFLILLLLAVSCNSQQEIETEAQPLQPINEREVAQLTTKGATKTAASPTGVVPATLTPIPSSTPIAASVEISTQTPAPSLTATVTPSSTPEPVIASTITALAKADPIDRTCPNPPPAKPDYAHYYLSGDEWPVPEASPEEHFWLKKPLPGGGRLLYTEWFPYGYDVGGRYLIHNGIDIAEPEGTPVLAVADGTVIVAGDDYSRLYGWRCDWYGHLVVIELERQWQDQPVYILYGHVLKIEVNPGQRVSIGQKVAEVGVGGAATLPHLHFEVRVGTNEFKSTRNPLLWLEPPATRGIIAGRLIDPEGRPWQGVAVTAVGRSDGTEDHTTWTYLDDSQHLINSDDTLAENFVIGDLLPGEYELFVELQGEIYRYPVNVYGGELSEAEVITAPFKTVTPTPLVSKAMTITPTPEKSN
jgi:lipoprotein NlpD